MKKTEAQKALLKTYGTRIDGLIESHLASGENNTKLHEACCYALLSGGKRVRPSIVLMVVDALGKGKDATPAALAIEFFHTASLIADDLPCMDNDDKRRELPSLHKAYGETTALLVSYGLIAAGYEMLMKNGGNEAEARDCLLAVENAAQNTGFFGATGGQFLDVFPPSYSIETAAEVVQKKTNSLFEIAFVCGWLFGGGNHKKLGQVKQAAHHFGTAFQLMDDMGDISQDKTNEREINFASLFGRERAEKMFHEELSRYLCAIKELGIATEALVGLGELLKEKAAKTSRK